MTTYAFRIASPQRIFQVERILRENGHDVLVPVEWRWKRIRKLHREREQVARPKLGPYGFISFQGLPRGFDEYFTRRFGFRYLTDAAGYPRPLPEGALEKVRAMSETPRKIRARNTHLHFRVNERVKVVDGPFEGETVAIAAIRGKHAVIMRQLFGAEREIMIEFTDLEKAA